MRASSATRVGCLMRWRSTMPSGRGFSRSGPGGRLPPKSSKAPARRHRFRSRGIHEEPSIAVGLRASLPRRFTGGMQAHHTRSTEEINMQRTLFQHIVPWALAAVCLSTMTNTTTAGSFLRGCAVHQMQILNMIEHPQNTNAVSAERLGNTMHTQIARIPDQKLDALAEAMRALTGHGLFAEEYDAILEAVQ